MAEQNVKRPRQDCSPERNCLDPQIIREAILNDINEPIVFRGFLTGKWKCLKWEAKDWRKVLGEDELMFRIGERVKENYKLKSPQWETECLKSTLRYTDFLEWTEGKKNLVTTCHAAVNCNDHWAYFDYFYMKDIKHPDPLQDSIDWGLFGFPERGLVDSTLWIGSTGANTPCHIDTYGCNLVAQVIGKKRWVLFPKSQSEYLSSTRVPYEESSIYSEVGFPRPDIQLHPKLVLTTPYVVTLEPGDVLFVPNQWWHSVENVEFAISVNTWIELPSDDEERVKETIVLHQIGSLCQGIESVDLIASAYNPNMMDAASMTSADLLNLLMSRIFQKKGLVEVETNSQKNKTFDWKNKEWCCSHNISKIEKMSFERYCVHVLGANFALDSNENKKVLNNTDGEIQFHQLKVLIDTFTDLRVIDKIKEVLDEKLNKPM